MDALRAWGDAPAFLLSCPGPLARHPASILPLDALELPQCLLGYEAQLLAFAAAAPDLAGRFFFTPVPENFSHGVSLGADGHGVGAGMAAPGGRPVVHLRFGGSRTARIAKGARNGCVVAEDHFGLPITPSLHPFASGLVLPAAVRRVFVYSPEVARLQGIGGEPVPVTLLPADCVTADIDKAAPGVRRASPRPGQGLDLVSFAEFRSGPWAAGPLKAASSHLRQARQRQAEDGVPFVLVPWNLDHPGSIVPELVQRLCRVQGALGAVRLIVMPFNYPGQAGFVRRLVTAVRQSAAAPEAMLAGLFFARLTSLAGLPGLRGLANVAWVDGNDPEHDWTRRRLAAAGISPVLLDPGDRGEAAGWRVAADEAVSIEAKGWYGTLVFRARLPSMRAWPGLLALSARLSGSRLPRAARAGGRRRSVAD